MEGHSGKVSGLGLGVYSYVGFWLYSYKDKLLRGMTEVLSGGAPQMPYFGTDTVIERHAYFKGTVRATQYLRNSSKPGRTGYAVHI